VTRSFLPFLLRRLAAYVVSVFAAFTVTFLFFHLIPGNPIEAYVTRLQESYGYSAPTSSQLIEYYEKTFGITGSLPHQYLLYLKNVFLHGNLGVSFISFPTPAATLIMQAMPWTIGLFGLAALLAWLLGVAAGIVVGWFRDRRVSQWVATTALGLSQIPYYLIALAFVYFFAYHLGWLPARDAYSAALTPALSPRFLFSVLRHALLPASSLVLVSLCGWLISTRALVVSILGEDYLIYAEAKGLKRGRILHRYVLRNALLPQVTGLAISLGFVVNGAYLVEYIFNWPGIGSLFVQALGQLDYNVLEGVVLISIIAVLTANLLIDLCLPLFDPRVQYE
jgi:peptide/nickel transport system permease protein